MVPYTFRTFGRIIVVGLAVAAAGCVDEPIDHHQHGPEANDAFRTLRQNLQLRNVNNGCSTSGVQGLSQQLLGEMACLSEGALVKVSHPNVTLTSNRVHPYLSPRGKQMLRRAADRAPIEINSALRTINEQYVLWKGCSVAADPGTSNHETGKAIDVNNYGQVDHILKDEGFSRPLPSSDPVHYEAPGQDLREYSVLAFQKLWNANHPDDQIAEDGVPGSETYARLKRAPAGGFQTSGVCDDGGGETYDAAIDVSLEGAGERVATGGSAGIRDLLPGESFNATITLTNESDAPIREVQLGYMVGEPYLEAVHYRIEDDHPEHDGASWERNDADEHPDNPSKSELGKRGKLHLYAMSPGESKRVVIELEATRYSFGQIDHPDVRGWLWHARDVYGEQTTYHDDPSNVNAIGESVRDYQQVDVFARDQWLFGGRDEEDDEGWRGDGLHDGFELNTDHEALAIEVTGADGGVVSPEWTSIDPEAFDELVVTTRSHEGPQTIALSFRKEGESYAEDRVVRFEASGEGAFETIVVPIGEHPEWRGDEITGIRIEPFGDREPADGDAWWFDLERVYAQNGSNEETSGEAVGYVDQPPVDLVDASEGGSTDETPGGDAGAGDADSDVGTGTAPGGPDAGTSDNREGGSRSVTTSSGCSVVGGDGPGPWTFVVFAILVVSRARRRP